MPKQTHRGKRRPRKTGKKRGPSNKTLAKRINKVSNTIIELKHTDVFIQNSAILQGNATTFLEGLFAGAVQGDTNKTRTGNRIYATSIDVNWTMTFNGALMAFNAQTNQRCRVIAFWDKQCNGALAGTSDVIDLSTVTDRTQAPRNYNTIHRIDIVYDKVFVGHPEYPFSWSAGNIVTAYHHPQIVKRKRFKFGRVITYDANDGLITDLNGNIFNMYMWTNNDGPADTEGPIVNLAARLYFKDG